MRPGLQVFASHELANNRTVCRLHRDSQDILAFGIFEIASYPGDRAAGADPGDDRGYLTTRIVPNFRPGCLLVDRGI